VAREATAMPGDTIGVDENFARSSGPGEGDSGHANPGSAKSSPSASARASARLSGSRAVAVAIPGRNPECSAGQGSDSHQCAQSMAAQGNAAQILQGASGSHGNMGAKSLVDFPRLLSPIAGHRNGDFQASLAEHEFRQLHLHDLGQ